MFTYHAGHEAPGAAGAPFVSMADLALLGTVAAEPLQVFRGQKTEIWGFGILYWVAPRPRGGLPALVFNGLQPSMLISLKAVP